MLRIGITRIEEVILHTRIVISETLRRNHPYPAV